MHTEKDNDMLQIIEADLPQIYEITDKIPEVAAGTGTVRGIQRLGGLTNHSYRVSLDSGDEYVVRIPGPGTEVLIRRDDEKICTELASRLGIDAKLLYFGQTGSKLSGYIEGAVTLSAAQMREPAVIPQIADVLRRIHHCGENTGVAFDVFDMAAHYEGIIEEHAVPMFADYPETKQAVMQAKSWVSQHIHSELQPCHNDPLCENWVMGTDRLFLIDWEYAGMNDGMWDLAAVSIEAGYDELCDQQLLAAYLGETTSVESLHFLASKIFVDYLWTLWAKARVPYSGQAMEDWAAERYARLKIFLKNFAKELAL
ncbi:MAG: hypothetical protein EOM12_02670 [Verrucomicrobiae bacterium]|nr:hypothetical protein [Verrucomicrobiae bacterium]